jgi:hypothetical protein
VADDLSVGWAFFQDWQEGLGQAHGMGSLESAT